MDKAQAATRDRVQMLADAGYYPKMKDETDIIFSDGENEVRLGMKDGTIRTMTDKAGNKYPGKLEDFLRGSRNKQSVQ